MLRSLAKLVRRFAPRRRWAQFSLGTLFLLVTVLCVWLGVVVNRAHRERAGVETAERLGGQVRFDYQMEYHERPANNVVYSDRETPGPAWLRRVIGDEYFRVAHSISLTGRPMFNGRRVTDADLARIAELKHLKMLQLFNAGATGSELTNGGLQRLTELKNLRVLWLQGVQLDPRGLIFLRQLPQLEYLNLRNTPVDDSALVYVGELKELYTLVLDGTQITDQGLVHLAGLTELNEWFCLADTAVTDAGLEHLKGFAKLEHLNLRRTKVTAAGVAKLRRSLPNTEISFGP